MQKEAVIVAPAAAAPKIAAKLAAHPTPPVPQKCRLKPHMPPSDQRNPAQQQAATPYPDRALL
ncbi:hypothetical protein [Neisseria polysaccharea]|uniref:Uncharacterized protein n=1 Tax=Neisseria polysaccharea TaxID=489 RepID=A0ABV1JJE0_NEIPO